MSTRYMLYVHTSDGAHLVCLGDSPNVSEAIRAVERQLPGVFPAGVLATGYVHDDGARPLKATRARGRRDVTWTRPGL